MEGKRLIEKIKLRNILSFGDKGEEITLEPLNIIIGQNASGKSNLIDVIKLLRSLTENRGLADFISKNGGIYEWLWKGNKREKNAEIELKINALIKNVKYKLKFKRNSQNLEITDEEIEDIKENIVIKRKDMHLIEGTDETSIIFHYLVLNNNNFARDLLRGFLAGLVIYADWQIIRSSDIRKPQLLSLTNRFLEEDATNLNLVLKDLNDKGLKDKIVENLKKFNPNYKDYNLVSFQEFIYLFIDEDKIEKPISAMRFSDGTLRYLCLLAILCHPEPPPLICIEEPETGLHPDILPTIAELMKEASQRTQLIVTTHSDILVSAFSDMPEAVLVCEKDEDGTHFKRLEEDKLKVWLEEYSLGEAWLRGAIGGTRW